LKKVLNSFGSIPVTIVLLLLFAIGSGVATFIENDYGTATAQADIYRAKWFEYLQVALTLNLIMVFYTHNMYKFKKWSISLFHLSFVFIAIGALMTRYFGFEGTMHIREGETVNTMLSETAYLKVKVDEVEKFYPMLFSNRGKNSFQTSQNGIDIELKEYLPYIDEKLIDSPDGKTTLKFIYLPHQDLEPIRTEIKEGEIYDGGFFVLDFKGDYVSNTPYPQEVIKISKNGKNLKLIRNSGENIAMLSMDSREEIIGSSEVNATERILYRFGENNLVFQEMLINKKRVLFSNVSAPKTVRDGLNNRLTFSINGKELQIFGKDGVQGSSNSIEVSGKKVTISYGAEIITLPFALHLKDFQMEKYPGSMSASSYASEVVLIDKEREIEKPYRIYMNNILDHRGYRFFQSSYDSDEMGTILSVNNDIGTPVTYFGYFLLILGMFVALFAKEGRLMVLRRKLKVMHSATLMLFAILLITVSDAKADEIETLFKFSKEHSDKFGQLLVQDSNGRLKPLDTLNREIVMKIHRKNSILGLTHNQVVLGMMLRPDLWRQLKVVSAKNERINEIVGVDKSEKYIAFESFFEDPLSLAGYKLQPYLEDAMRLEPKKRGRFEKELLKVDERVNVAYMVYTGTLLKLYPKENDPNSSWYSTVDALQQFEPLQAEVVRALTLGWFEGIDKGIDSGDWSEADKNLRGILNYQKRNGADIYLSESRLQIELAYNNWNIFERLTLPMFIIGLILMVIGFIQVFKESLEFRKTIFLVKTVLSLLFLLFTLGMAMRWYISGHAPWSDAYESLLYIGWATLLAGFIFSKRSSLTLSATTMLTGVILLVAHLSWLDPQITNLVPVLKSYWLTIHVSLITASYGFLGLGAFLGLFILVLFALKNESNSEKLSRKIRELNIINEMNLIVGLVLLTVGNFLGGVWANESWGRYWGWDAKETWALVTILVYAVVIHIRFMPKIYSQYSFALLSVIAFTSVIMTYFGVNFYLSGMHSYAQGDPVPIPMFVYYTIGSIFLLSILAYRKRVL